MAGIYALDEVWGSGEILFFILFIGLDRLRRCMPWTRFGGVERTRIYTYIRIYIHKYSVARFYFLFIFILLDSLCRKNARCFQDIFFMYEN
jgi:hypothetical protein